MVQIALNESAVVSVSRMSLAGAAEVSVVAYSALVSNASDVSLVSFAIAQWPIAVDAEVADERAVRLWDWRVDSSEAMARMSGLRILHAIVTEVPVRAVQALVADAVDELFTPIANSSVADVAARSAEELSQRSNGAGLGRLESVTRVVAMLRAHVARHAEVVILAIDTGDEVALGEDLDARVAGASRLLRLHGLRLLLGHELLGRESTGHFLLLGLDLDLRHGLRLRLLRGLGSNPLGGAVGDLAILDETLNQPVTLTRAVVARGNAVLAEVIVALVANAAVVVLVGHGLVTDIAVDGPRE